MKNLKKVLALALAFAMSLSLFAGAAFTDAAEINVDYTDDVNMLVQLGVIGGYPDGSFKPQGNITRAEYAKMAYTLKYGYDDSGKLFAGQNSIFTDVQGNANVAWAKGYINYCANQGIIGGVGNNKFNPNGKVTVAEAAKMLLVILGCDAVKEGFGGANWSGNVVAKAMELGVFDGWVGDPTAPASRELVCKLMRNTIFAPVYIYSPLTGIGTQVSITNSNIKNETLGEKTMGLKHVHGMVVSNGRYALALDAEGDATGAQKAKDRSQIWWYDAETDTKGLSSFEVDLSDDMIGSIVDVYYKVSSASNTNYKNYEIIGDVLVSSETVAYEVAAADIEIMPNGESKSTRTIKPYISITTADGEVTIDAPSTFTTRFPMNVKYNGKAFEDMMYYSDVAAGGTATGLIPLAGAFTAGTAGNESVPNGAQTANEYKFWSDMGKNVMDTYRFVSVDGGKTFSYIFRLANKKLAKVTSYNDSKISLTAGIGQKDMEDEVVVLGDIKKGDKVIAYTMNDKLYVEPTKTINGKATNLRDETATINGEVYRADVSVLGAELDAYFTSASNAGKNNENTEYVVYNNFVLEIDGTAIAASASDYAVILYSDFDEKTGVASATFGFADNTIATYDISMLNSNSVKDYELALNFNDNGMVGALVRVKIEGGKANLSANTYANLNAKVNAVNGGSQITSVYEGTFLKGASKYYDNGNSLVFAIYGGEEVKDSQGASYNPKVYSALKSRAYKLSAISNLVGQGKSVMMDTDTDAVPTTADGNGNIPTDYAATWLGDVVTTQDSDGLNTLLVGSFSVGTSGGAGISDDTNNIGYLLSAKVRYNVESEKNYLDVKMITPAGLIETRTIDDVTDENGALVQVGAVNTDAFTNDVMVVYELTASEVEGDSSEWILSISNMAGIGSKAAVEQYGNLVANNANYFMYDGQGKIRAGMYAVRAALVRDDILGFFTINDTVDGSDNNWNAMRQEKLDDDVQVIAIDDENVVEEGDVETITKGDIVSSGDYNAIIVVNDTQEITHIFSLWNNF